MPTAKETLIKLIEEHKDELVVRTCNKLQKFSQSHYENVAYEKHLEREELFLNVLLQTLADESSDALPQYVKQLVEERSNEGYNLREIEEAFDIVEDTLWEVLTKYCPLEQSLIEVLAIVRKLIRKAKNSFSQLFFDDALTARKLFHEIHEKFAVYRHEISDQQE